MSVMLDDTALDLLCPMYLRVGLDGTILQAGPTVFHSRPGVDLIGAQFSEIFEMVLPRSGQHVQALADRAPLRIKLKFAQPPRTTCKGVLMALPGRDEVLINLSFGISVVDAVRDYSLTGADFAHTDLAIELLYLIEAKSAAMDASRVLNQRLQGARMVAEERAFTDALTGLKNRRALDLELARLCGIDAHFALMHIDLDKFKAVNDSLGHAAGDTVLKHVASAMIGETRTDDTVVRIGGDEFVLVLPGLQDEPGMDGLASRLIERIERPVRHGEHDIKISASAGTVMSQMLPETDPENMLHLADLALYDAKRSGRGRHAFYRATENRE